MKDVKVQRMPVFLEPIPGLTPGVPPLDGWTVQHVSGMEGAQPGYFLTVWQPAGKFAFAAQPFLCIKDEDEAKRICVALHESGIEAKVIRYPVHRFA